MDNPKSYQLIDPNFANEGLDRTFNITSTGRWWNIAALSYEGLEITDYLGLWVLENNTPRIVSLGSWNKPEEYGIVEYKFDNRSNLVFIKFDKSIILDKKVYGFQLEGQIKVDISKDFYVNATPIECRSGNCTVELTIVNNLPQWVGSGEKVIFFADPIVRGRNCNLIFVSGEGVLDEAKYSKVVKKLNKTTFPIIVTLSEGEFDANGFVDVFSTKIKPSYSYASRFQPTYMRIDSLVRVNLNLTFFCE